MLQYRSKDKRTECEPLQFAMNKLWSYDQYHNSTQNMHNRVIAHIQKARWNNKIKQSPLLMLDGALMVSMVRNFRSDHIYIRDIVAFLWHTKNRHKFWDFVSATAKNKPPQRSKPTHCSWRPPWQRVGQWRFGEENGFSREWVVVLTDFLA